MSELTETPASLDDVLEAKRELEDRLDDIERRIRSGELRHEHFFVSAYPGINAPLRCRDCGLGLTADQIAANAAAWRPKARG